jgi:hypothetical protein
MGQQRWEAAEESLNKSVALFEPQIERALSRIANLAERNMPGTFLGRRPDVLLNDSVSARRSYHRRSESRRTGLQRGDPSACADYIRERRPKAGSSIAQQSGEEAAIAQW